MDEIVLGNVVVIGTTFDALPASATVVLSYVDANHVRQTSAPVDLVVTGSGALTFTAEWDTEDAGAGPGQVDYHIQADDPRAATDGSFMLTANKANVV